jgi:two-component system, OmpR family, sensor histidine kinase BaeS
LLTFVILVSAALRLSLYQDAYGWTELRFYIDATIAWLGLGIAAAVVLLVRDRMRWLVHAMTVSAVVILVAVNLVGAQRHVADANVARLLDPSLVPPDGRHGLDLDYALTLGDDAVPALVAALPALSDGDRALAMSDLEDRWRELQRPTATNWPAWNLARERARAALATLFGS